MNKGFLAGCFCLIFFWIGCAKSPNFSDTPELSFVSISKNSLLQGDINNDSLTVTINFTDGDGDIGLTRDDISQNLRIIDSRTGELASSFKIPEIPASGSNNGIRGTMRFRVFSTCCIYTNGQAPCEASTLIPTNVLKLAITLSDRAGNVSNTVETSPITLICN